MTTMIKKKTIKSKRNTGKKEFVCLTCGYEAYKMAKLSSCPLCVICKSCEQRVKKCCCIEGE